MSFKLTRLKENLQIMKKAKELISVQERWTKGTLARREDGREVLETANDATCWCSVGAISKVNKELFNSDNISIPLNYLSQGVKETNKAYDWIVDYNDNRTHKSVMKVWDKAIKNLQQDIAELEQVGE